VEIGKGIHFHEIEAEHGTLTKGEQGLAHLP
jgi:hypothetical protein